MEKNMKRIYICITQSLCCTAEIKHIVNQLYFSQGKTKKDVPVALSWRSVQILWSHSIDQTGFKPSSSYWRCVKWIVKTAESRREMQDKPNYLNDFSTPMKFKESYLKISSFTCDWLCFTWVWKGSVLGH